MVDPIALSIAIGAVILGIFAHIKSSKCGKNCGFTTRTPENSNNNSRSSHN